MADDQCQGGAKAASENDAQQHDTSAVNIIRRYRPRNSSVVQYDVQAQSGEEHSDELPPLLKSYEDEHNRGEYIMPTLDPNYFGADEYAKLAGKPGEVFIFNFETFDYDIRSGTRLDVKALIDVLGRLKFNIRTGQIYNNLSKQQVFDTIHAATATFQKQNIDCLIVMFLTHGYENNMILARDEAIDVDEIIKAFCVQKLAGVPKWFTFLACKEPREKSDDAEVQKSIVNYQAKIVSNSTYVKDLPNDVIVYYSTNEGMKSVRIRNEGTWVIQELCRNLAAYGRRDDIFSILTRTNKCVALNYHIRISEEEDEDTSEASDLTQESSDRKRTCFRQCPVIQSTLSKKFYLTVSKDRIAQVEHLHKVREIQKRIKKS